MNILNLFGITNAYAANAGGTTGQGLMSMLPMFIVLILIMYFLIIRPQSKRAKEHRQLVSNLKKGDEVITNGGLLGTIVKISENFMVINIAQGVEIHIQKGAIATSVPKGTIKSV